MDEAASLSERLSNVHKEVFHKKNTSSSRESSIYKEASYGDKNPLFLRFIHRKMSVIDLLNTYSQSEDPYTAEAAKKVLADPPDLEDFRKELEDAVRDIVVDGPGEEFKAFVNHYMEPAIYQYSDTEKTPFGENRKHTACLKDESAPWIQGFVCYNLCLYIKAFGLECLKACKTCGTLFSHKGKWAVYCADSCNPKKK